MRRTETYVVEGAIVGLADNFADVNRSGCTVSVQYLSPFLTTGHTRDMHLHRGAAPDMGVRSPDTAAGR